ncbi:MAG: insulinase family protein, partial [Alphaproteobacteria bacterium]|nr:insulinase family protein [Alphaproteobacteria bacterium]
MNIIELKNGLKIILEKRKGTGLVSIDTSINCGYAYESKPGTSIITSKTLIKGTKSLSLDKILQKTEGEGGEIISSTDTDYSDITMFTHSANTYEQIKILASILTEPLFDEEEIEKQKKLVLNNIKSIKDNPSSYVSVKFLEKAFQNQPYANTPLTQESEIEKITQKDVKELFSKYYNASNIVVSIVGDINLEKVKETCEEHLSKIPAGEKQDLPKSEYTPFYLIKEDNNIDQANLKLCFKGVGRDHPDYLTYKLLIATISGGFSSRMFKAMRIEDQLVYSFNLTNLGFKSDGVFCINAGTGKGKAEILIPKAMQELANFISTIENEEVESAITAYEKSFQNNLYDLNACSSFYSYELLKYGFVHNSKNLQNKLKKISKNDLLRISLDILKSEPSLISVGPKDGIHSKEEIVSIKNKIVNEINFEEALKRAGSTETNPQWLPLKETEEDYGEFKISKLKNGLRIISQNRPNNLVTCGYWVGAGGQNETPEEHGISHMLEHMVFKGTKNFGPEEIDGIIEKKLSCYLNAFTTKDKTCYYSYNISPDNIYKIANLLGEMVFTPTLSDVEFNGGIKEDGSIMKDGEKEVVFEEINRSNDTVSNLVYYGRSIYFFKNNFFFSIFHD